MIVSLLLGWGGARSVRLEDGDQLHEAWDVVLNLLECEYVGNLVCSMLWEMMVFRVIFIVGEQLAADWVE